MSKLRKSKSAIIDNTVEVNVLDNEYTLACPAEEVDNLKEAAKYLDVQLRELRKRSVSGSKDKITIVTALNITNELLKLRSGAEDSGDLGTQLDKISAKAEAALTTEK